LENRLRLLYALQRVDSNLDELRELKGDLPQIVTNLESQLQAKERTRQELEQGIKHGIVRRDEIDLEIITTREKIEKYKEQQFQIKTNKQYDALTREIDTSQEKINQLAKEMDTLEGRATVAKSDLEKLLPEIEELKEELEGRRKELDLLNKEHEDEELKLKHEREKLVVRIDKSDVRMYERIRKAMGGKAVVPIRRNACGGCFKRVTPQAAVELRKNSKLMACEHCGRLLVSDEIVESYSTAL
jgi:predicted  nucleic acid-binding Zn-ribbon protein